ncbi:hypothetical protein NC796_13465 [Aliifodinibius sp. S!AR15-10]|uniref:hypothetical protein n=1 Tax=Aliifodinibius sp. S!AR15-10 TaxID=2950437 RepID=UPI00285F2525|nr:hypothetical protein [Aliifodinibius sp. S!AR15-10]MDR8392157.1 hypothetical protein [Aliifodinibius sp. S!AR15-10]
MNRRFQLLLLLVGFLGVQSLLPGQVHAQLSPSNYSYPYHHLSWYTLESEHFLIHFQDGNSRSAQVASRIAEEVYPHITELYGIEPDSKTSIVLKDREDYSNGAAYFFDNQIDIWVPALDSPLRGTHDWMRDVISHEFTHIVQLTASMKRSRTLPAIYLQWLSYEDVRRPDVLYGYPKGLLTYPFSSISVPGWFAEGVAQYQRTGWSYDTWDSHRDMVLRTAILNDNYLSFDEMGTFSSKTSLEREQVYNQGFGFTIFLAHRYGESVLSEISDTLSTGGVNSIDLAIQQVTGKSGQELFEEWILEREDFYSSAVGSINSQESELIEPKGYFNFYPTYSPDGTKITYLSNKKISESAVSLFVRDLQTGTSKGTEIDLTPRAHPRQFALSCGFSEEPLINRIRSSFSFAPDGRRLVFTRTTLNKYGERYNDLFFYDFESESTDRLTYSARLHDPSWSPDGEQIAAVQVAQGTANLVLVNTQNGSVEKLTHFEDGEQVYKPEWGLGGQEIFFSFAEKMGRSIRRFNLERQQAEPFLKEQFIDFRTPFIDPQGDYLYYSSDPDGIFNIYRVPLDSPEASQKLTSVTGGAFMPTLSDKGRLTYAEYREGGYKIVSKKLPEFPQSIIWGSYRPPAPREISFPDNPNSFTELNNFNDSDIDPLDENTLTNADTGRVNMQIPTVNGSDQRQLYSYDQEFTKFSFYPVIRFDNYSKFNGSNSSLLRAGDFGGLGENLVRDLKIGTYFSSREVTNRLNIFGGALFGVGSRSADGIGDFFSPSRLTDLDRDLFLITEYRGLPFIKKRWSPTLAVELYNMRRNVNGGLSVEEFPCTSCLPDTTSVDIAYNIWEIDLFLRSKIDAHSLVELGIGYTPYRVQTDAFFSRELEQLVPSSSTEYYRGTLLTAAYVYESFLPYPHSDTAPIGLRASLRYNYRPSQLLENFEIEDGSLSPVYQKSKNHSVELSSRYGFEMGDFTTGQVYSRFFSYFSNPGDTFYLDYIGGFTGMRSYPYFALSGNTTAFSEFSYIFPLFTDINEQVGRHSFDKLFLRLFGEVGNGWNGPEGTGANLKAGIGAELRFSLNSYYLYPLKFFISGAYGFNKFDVTLPDEFITESSSNKVSYGREPIIHFGFTFDFEILNHD